MRLTRTSIKEPDKQGKRESAKELVRGAAEKVKGGKMGRAVRRAREAMGREAVITPEDEVPLLRVSDSEGDWGTSKGRKKLQKRGKDGLVGKGKGDSQKREKDEKQEKSEDEKREEERRKAGARAERQERRLMPLRYVF